MDVCLIQEVNFCQLTAGGGRCEDTSTDGVCAANTDDDDCKSIRDALDSDPDFQNTRKDYYERTGQDFNKETGVTQATCSTCGGGLFDTNVCDVTECHALGCFVIGDESGRVSSDECFAGIPNGEECDGARDNDESCSSGICEETVVGEKFFGGDKKEWLCVSSESEIKLGNIGFYALGAVIFIAMIAILIKVTGKKKKR